MGLRDMELVLLILGLVWLVVIWYMLKIRRLPSDEDALLLLVNKKLEDSKGFWMMRPYKDEALTIKVMTGEARYLEDIEHRIIHKAAQKRGDPERWVKYMQDMGYGVCREAYPEIWEKPSFACDDCVLSGHTFNMASPSAGGATFWREKSEDYGVCCRHSEVSPKGNLVSARESCEFQEKLTNGESG